MSMRNFWIETDVEGRQSLVKGGPRSKNGTMTTKLYVKACGSEEVVRIDCYPTVDADTEEEVLRVHFRFADGTVKNISVNKGEISYEK